MITIRVFRESGNASAKGVKVSVHSSTGTRDARTDSNGSADFPYDGGKDYKVYVDGREVYRGTIVGVHTVYI
jgi:hypothetical protein